MVCGYEGGLLENDEAFDEERLHGVGDNVFFHS